MKSRYLTLISAVAFGLVAATQSFAADDKKIGAKGTNPAYPKKMEAGSEKEKMPTNNPLPASGANPKSLKLDAKASQEDIDKATPNSLKAKGVAPKYPKTEKK